MGSCWPCHSWTHSAPVLHNIRALSPYQRPHACHPTTWSWLCRWKTEPSVLGTSCHGQGVGNHLPWTMKFSPSNLSPSMDLPLVPLWRVKSPPWYIHPRISLWKQKALTPNPCSPVLRAGKFSAVFGTLSAKAQKRRSPRAHGWVQVGLGGGVWKSKFINFWQQLCATKKEMHCQLIVTLHYL